MSFLLGLSGVSGQSTKDIPEAYQGAWRALLHYQDVNGTWRSEIEDPSFFLDPEGPKEPEKEWAAHRQAFLAPPGPGPQDRHAICRFPARFALMRKALGWSGRGLPLPDCPMFREHQQRLAAESVSVVFVSHHLSNPASTFGHTLLYLGSGEGRDAILANYSVSFEADTEGMTPGEYLPRGLFGRLVARYRLAPLHERVRRYEREEQRDLWLFPIRLRREETAQLVRHLWELEGVEFRYGFFGGNCAQKILSLLHAVAPDYGFLPFRKVAVLPSEVARRVVDRVGMGAEPLHRPSLRNQFEQRVSGLSRTEKGLFEEMVESRTVVQEASRETLLAVLLWSELQTPYRTFRRANDSEDHPDLVWRRSLWTALATHGHSISQGSIRPLGRSGPSILEGHRSSLLSVRSGFREGAGLVFGGRTRWLLHEAVDPQPGYPQFSTVEVARLDIEVRPSGRIWLEEATALRIARLSPPSHRRSAFAWRVDIGGRRLAYDGEFPTHWGAEVDIGRGLALIGRDNYLGLYSMVGVRPGALVAESGTSFLLAAIWTGGVILRFPWDLRAAFSGEYSFSLSGFDGGGVAVYSILRKGIGPSRDLELTATVGPEQSGISFGVATFH